MRAKLLFLLLLLLTVPGWTDSPYQASFDLGNYLSTAVLGRAAQADPQAVERMLKSANRAASVLTMTVPPLPSLTGDKSKDVTAAIDFLLKGTTPLLSKMNEKQAAVFDLAIKSNILGVLYQPGKDQGLVKVLKDRCLIAKIKDVTGPLEKAVKSKASAESVAGLIEQFQTGVRTQL